MINNLSVLAVPWVFSQSHPLTTSIVISELEKRSVSLNAQTLRELYRRGDLRPIAEITTRRVRAPVAITSFPAAQGGLQSELRRALATGHVRDPGADDFRPRLRFDSRKNSDPPHWKNGLIYSRWQLLAAPELRRRLPSRREFGPHGRRRVVLRHWTSGHGCPSRE